MSSQIKFEIKLNFLTIFIISLILHALFIIFPSYKNSLQEDHLNTFKKSKNPLIIKDIRTIGTQNTKSKNDVYLAKSYQNTKKINSIKQKNKINSFDQLSLKDFSKNIQNSNNQSRKVLRPGSLPAISPKAISGIGLRGNQMRRFVEGQSKSISHDAHSSTLSNSDIAVNLEVPEGVSPDELNKFELMFYGFQRRTAINYINSFYKNLDKFKQANPHLHFPMTDAKQIMTGRLTYDEKGNVKQIKMIRWSNIEKLQDFFLDVLKDMDTLHNPPQALWKKTGEFSIYFSFVVNG